MGLCTKELVMFEVAMECHGDRFRTSGLSMVSLEPLKEVLINPTQMHLPDDTRGVHAPPGLFSSNLGRVNQGEAIREDVVKPRVQREMA